MASWIAIQSPFCRCAPVLPAIASRISDAAASPLTIVGNASRWAPLTFVVRRHTQHSESFNSSVLSLCPCLKAKRKSDGAAVNADDDEELDEDLRAGLNEISTEALKAMLSEDSRLVSPLREKVDYLGEYLVQEKQLDAARFMLIIKGMLDHKLYPEKDELKGAYKKAFDKIATIIEDSGWVLKQPDADVAGVEMVDDELIPPVLNSQY